MISQYKERLEKLQQYKKLMSEINRTFKLELDRDVNSAINIRNSEARLEPVLGKGGEKLTASLVESGRRYKIS